MNLGYIQVTKHYHDPIDNIETFEFDWISRDWVKVSFEFLRDARRDIVRYDNPVVEGGTIEIGPFTLRIFDIDFHREIYVCLRQRWLVTSLRYRWHRIVRALSRLRRMRER